MSAFSNNDADTATLAPTRAASTFEDFVSAVSRYSISDLLPSRAPSQHSKEYEGYSYSNRNMEHIYRPHMARLAQDQYAAQCLSLKGMEAFLASQQETQSLLKEIRDELRSSRGQTSSTDE